MPPGLSPIHLVVIFVVALVVLGPDKMPDAVRKGASLLGEVRQWSTRMSDEVQSAVSLHSQDVTVPKAETWIQPSGESTVAATPPESESTVAEGSSGTQPVSTAAQASDISPVPSDAEPGDAHAAPVAKEDS